MSLSLTDFCNDTLGIYGYLNEIYTYIILCSEWEYNVNDIFKYLENYNL